MIGRRGARGVSGTPARWVRYAGALGLVIAAACVALLSAGCGSDDEFVGTWLRTDDQGFVLTITHRETAGYELRFENTSNDEVQTIAGLRRSGDTLQAALQIPREPVGALAAGVPEIVPVTLKIGDDGLMTVSMDGAGGERPIELWRYRRSDE